MAGVHKNTKGLRCPSFRSLTKSLDTCLGAVTELQEPNSPEPCRPTRRRSTETGNSSPRQCHGRRQPRSWEVVFKTERQKTPPVEILFRNMTSSAIFSETRNSL